MTSIPLKRSFSLSGAFTRAEQVIMVMIVGMFVANLFVDYKSDDHVVGWASFALGVLGAVGLALLGAYYRIVYARFAWLGKAAVTVSLASLFGVLVGILIHQQMPRPEPVLTEWLLATDAWFGFHWPSAVAWVAEVPYLGTFLKQVYFSSFIQIMVLFIVLARKQSHFQLDWMMYTNSLALMLVFVIWQAFPNISQSTYLPIPADVALKADLVTNSLYGAHILDLAQNGLSVLTLESMLGAIAFPSYHSVMWALVIVFSWRTAFFWPILMINIIMVPGILVHGAHHVADWIGGAVIMLIAMVPAYLIVAACDRADEREA